MRAKTHFFCDVGHFRKSPVHGESRLDELMLTFYGPFHSDPSASFNNISGPNTPVAPGFNVVMKHHRSLNAEGPNSVRCRPSAFRNASPSLTCLHTLLVINTVRSWFSSLRS